MTAGPAPRPRDALGRPVPAEQAIDLPVVPVGPISADAARASAISSLDQGLPFHAHEVLEERWRCSPPEERELWRALARLAAAVTHAGRGNDTGAYAVGRTALADLLAHLPPAT